MVQRTSDRDMRSQASVRNAGRDDSQEVSAPRGSQGGADPDRELVASRQDVSVYNTSEPSIEEYCYARFFVADADRRDSWGSWILAKQNAGELLARACTSGTLRTGDAIYMSSVTDPYQPVEQRLEHPGFSRG